MEISVFYGRSGKIKHGPPSLLPLRSPASTRPSRKKRREELLLQKNINWSLLSRHGGLKEAQEEEEGQLLDEEGGGAARLFSFLLFLFPGEEQQFPCLACSSPLLSFLVRHGIQFVLFSLRLSREAEVEFTLSEVARLF